MLRLRPFKPGDADIIASWIKDEKALRRWSADRYEGFPVAGEDINRKYLEHNGDCVEPDNFYPVTAFDENGLVGHLIMRYTDAEKRVLRFGFVIVDDTRRGMGYGKEMMSLALSYAFEIFKAEKVTLGVFENNISACNCYKRVGFREILMGEPVYYSIDGQQWKCLELEIAAEEYKNTLIHVEHIAMYVHDLEKARDFFVTYLDGCSNGGYFNPVTGFRSYFISFSNGARLELMNSPDMTDAQKSLKQIGYSHLAFSLGSKEVVDKLTARLSADGYTVVSGPRTTGDGYYESCIIGVEGNIIELTV